MKNEKGFTLGDVMIIAAIIGIVVSIAAESFVNNRGVTEKRAFARAKKFLNRNNIEAKRLTCAGDSDNDGYGTCNIVTKDGEKIILNCPTDFLDTKLFGASECKEVFQNINFSFGQNG